MSMIIRVPSVNWAGKGFPNTRPFIPTGLTYGFDLRTRSSMLTDVTGAYTITPMRTDASLSIFNQVDSTILVPVDGDLGQRVELGYLQSSEAVAAFAWGGAPFTIMVAGRGGGVAFPTGKVVISAPNGGILYDFGSQVGINGFTLDLAISTGQQYSRIENGSPSLLPDPTSRSVTQPQVHFLTYDGTNWTLYNKTFALSATGTNTSLSVGNPIAVSSTPTQGKVNLGGNAHQTSTLNAYYPVIYQTAKWNRVLSVAEMDDQYARTKATRPLLAL